MQTHSSSLYIVPLLLQPIDFIFHFLPPRPLALSLSFPLPVFLPLHDTLTRRRSRLLLPSLHSCTFILLHLSLQGSARESLFQSADVLLLCERLLSQRLFLYRQPLGQELQLQPIAFVLLFAKRSPEKGTVLNELPARDSIVSLPRRPIDEVDLRRTRVQQSRLLAKLTSQCFPRASQCASMACCHTCQCSPRQSARVQSKRYCPNLP